MSQDAPHARLRAAGRIANGFALELVQRASFGRDALDALLICAISQANVSLITRNPELQHRYALLDQPPPDDLRRPVSVSAIANSLRIPFETARRRIGALIELGVVVSQRRGIIIPAGPMNSPIYRMIATAHFDLVRDLYFRLRGIGLLEDLPRPANPAYDAENPPVRLVVRLSSDYVLRLAEPISEHIGDLVSGLLLTSVIHANTEHLPDTDAGQADAGWSVAGFVPDDARRPVRASELAARLGMAHETVRRHLGRLAADDRCERNEHGYIVPARVLAREPFVRFMMDNQSHLHRLFAQLSDYGVLSEWERQVVALRGAA